LPLSEPKAILLDMAPSAPADRYADFPELFWDATPEANIDVSNVVVLARVITRGSMDAIARLVSPSVLERELPHLVIDEAARRFWQRVLSKLPRAAGPATPTA